MAINSVANYSFSTREKKVMCCSATQFAQNLIAKRDKKFLGGAGGGFSKKPPAIPKQTNSPINHIFYIDTLGQDEV